MTESLSYKLKALGIRSVKKLAEAEGVGTPTLHRWHKQQPALLQAAIDRYLRNK